MKALHPQIFLKFQRSLLSYLVIVAHQDFYYKWQCREGTDKESQEAAQPNSHIVIGPHSSTPAGAWPAERIEAA